MRMGYKSVMELDLVASTCKGRIDHREESHVTIKSLAKGRQRDLECISKTKC